MEPLPTPVGILVLEDCSRSSNLMKDIEENTSEIAAIGFPGVADLAFQV